MTSVQPDRQDAQAGPEVGAKIGIDYFKFMYGQAENADRFMFDVTKYNLIAFAAIASFGLSNASTSVDKRLITIVLCASVMVVSVASSILVFYYKRYSEYLYAKSWIIEKAWLRGINGPSLVERLRAHNKTWVAQKKDQGKLFYIREFKRYFPFVNLLPGFLGVIMLLLVSAGVVKVSAAPTVPGAPAQSRPISP